MFKKLMQAALAMAMLAVAAPGVSAEEGYWQRVQSAGKLRCGAAIAPPFVMRDPATGNYSGVFSDVCRGFADVLGVQAEFVDTTWDNIVAGLQAGKWDMSMALNRTPVRAMAIGFSEPVVQYEISLVYNKDNPKIPADPKSLADVDVAGVTLTLMSGTAQDHTVSRLVKNATILRLPTNDETRLAMVSKRADVLIDDASTNELFVRANPDWAVSFLPDPALSKQGIAYGLPAQLSYNDISALNIYIEELKATGVVDEMFTKAVDEVLATQQ